MPIFVLINARYLQEVAFSFEKSPSGQNHSSSGSHHLIKKFIPAKFLIPPQGEGGGSHPKLHFQYDIMHVVLYMAGFSSGGTEEKNSKQKIQNWVVGSEGLGYFVI